MINQREIEKAFDVMLVYFAKAGVDVLTIGKLVEMNRRMLGLAPVGEIAQKAKVAMAQNLAEMEKEHAIGPSVDGGATPSKARIPSRPS